MMIWPSGLVVLIVSGYMRGERPDYGKIILWLVAAVVSIAIYFYGYETSSTAENITLTEKIISSIKRPHVFMILFTTYLGAPLASYRQSMALAAGAAGLAVNIWCVVAILRGKLRDKNYSFWLGADAYILLSAAVTAYGRQGTISTAMALRYMSLQMLFWIITPCMFFMTLEKKQSVSLKIYLLIAALIISHSVSEDALIRACERYNGLNLVSNQLKAGVYDDMTFRKYIAGRKEALMLPELKAHGVKFLRNAPDVIAFDDFRKVDFDAKDIQQSEDTSFSASAWVNTDGKFMGASGWWKIDNFSQKDRTHARTFVIIYNNDATYEAVLGKWEGVHSFTIKRSDNLREDSEKYSFGDSELYCANIPAGTYSVAVKVSAHDGKNYYFPVNNELTITR